MPKVTLSAFFVFVAAIRRTSGFSLLPGGTSGEREEGVKMSGRGRWREMVKREMVRSRR